MQKENALSVSIELIIRNNKRICTWQEAVTILNIATSNINQAIDIANQLSNIFPRAIAEKHFKNSAEYHQFFQLLLKLQQFSSLISCANTAVKHFPQDAQSYYLLSMANRQMRKESDSLSALITATKLMPNQIQWQLLLGIFYKERDQREQAILCFNTCIKLQPDYGEAYWQRSNFMPTLSDEDLELLVAIANSHEMATPSVDNNKIFAAYSLFRHYDEINNPALAFAFLDKGARLKRKQLSFDITKEINEHQQIAKSYSQTLINRTRIKQNQVNQHLPSIETTKNGCIFICGLPRSGSTLIEHILSAHSHVTAGDELFSLAQATQLITSTKKDLKSFPDWAQQLSIEEWQDIGSGYLELTAPLRESAYLTDKMPLNYKAIGLIQLALPTAKIIYCYRHPMDILFGCFKQLLGQGNAYTYQLDEMAQMIIAQHKLMQHWQCLFPDKIFTLTYEHLVSDQQTTIKNLLNFLELSWEDNCLNFYQSKRTVHTISNLQIREPISDKNIANWKKYHTYLLPYYELFLAHNILPD